ncbi:hypothetical protein [Bradyrhizobium sp. USDA 4350]
MSDHIEVEEPEFSEDVVLIHAPVVPPRKSIYGEGIYVEHWQRFITSPIEYGDGYANDRFISMFGHLPGIIRPSDATDAAAFICWLGTNCGRGFMRRGADIAKKLEPREREEAYLFAWALNNIRHAGMNGGRRTSAAIVADACPRTLEVFEIVAGWLGTADGLALMKAAEAEIEETRKAIWAREDMQMRARRRAIELEAK